MFRCSAAIASILLAAVMLCWVPRHSAIYQTSNFLSPFIASSKVTNSPAVAFENIGAGSPILIAVSALNPFSNYYGEILRAEGMNEYVVMDLSRIDSTVLAHYDIVILGDISLSSGQVEMIKSWVVRGGNLITFHPDKQLSTLLGLAPTTSNLSNAYLKVKTDYGPGVGIVGQTIQFHGTADLYVLDGASAVATLFLTANTPTKYPAVTIINVGAGQAAAFTYDLARSVIYTRQGNPAWSGQKRDGQMPPVRSDDLYLGAANSDPEPNWLDLSKVSIPQADEQQRLLANLILQMNASREPLPRFWYFPKGFKAVVVMTGDDHGHNGTSRRFDSYIGDSTAGCSIADWECVRATSYIYPSTPITTAQAATYLAQGFEIALHVTTDCLDWTPQGLELDYAMQLTNLASKLPNIPSPRSVRTHCIAWSDYDTEPKVERSRGIRLDTNYYYWPATWAKNRPGMFTGSGMPMRFSDRSGNLIDVYQATTQMTDESGQPYPLTVDTLLGNAVGSQEFYGAFTANMHNDLPQSNGADAIVASAKAHGVPVVSALQMLTWLDGRNSSSFSSISWSGNTLTFNINQAAGARNLRAMLPADGPTGTLRSISSNGTPIAFEVQKIKGITYAIFNATPSVYEAIYGGA